MSNKIGQLFKKNAPIIYKLSCDTLFIMLVFFLLVLVAEGALPGIISSHIGIYKIVIAICANIFFTLTVQNLFLSERDSKYNKKIAWTVFGTTLILIFNSLFSLSTYLDLFILIISSIIIFYIFKIFQEEN